MQEVNLRSFAQSTKNALNLAKMGQLKAFFASSLANSPKISVSVPGISIELSQYRSQLWPPFVRFQATIPGLLPLLLMLLPSLCQLQPRAPGPGNIP